MSNRVVASPDRLGKLTSEGPKGKQLYDKLDALLSELPVGAMLPSERVLAERLGVARMTVRNQIEQLARSGRVTREIGKGTFVAEPRVPIGPVLPSFSREIAALGMVPGVASASAVVVPAKKPLTTELQVSPGRPVVHLHRVRTADDVPLAIEHTFLSLDRFPELDKAPFESISIRDHLRDAYGCIVVRADRRITIAELSPDDAAQLGVPAKTVAFYAEVTTYDDEDRVVEVGTALIRADRFEIRLSVDSRTAP
ncbi:MAG: GntR family transcriptional regulator [Microbacterium sp.]